MKIKDWLNKVYLYSKTNHYIYNECYIFLEFLLKKNRIWIEININYKLNFKIIEYLNIFLLRRLKGEPIAYILNCYYFLDIKYIIYQDIFIPRLGTEYMVIFSIKLIKKKKLTNILDLGSGSGVIACAISKNCINVNIFALDNNFLSLILIKINCLKLNIYNIHILKSNWFMNVKNKFNFFDLIISNPPYIWNKDNCINKNDLRFECENSLLSNHKGWGDIIYIIKSSYHYLNDKGWLIVEHSLINLNKIIYFFKKYYYNVFTYKGIHYNYRFTVGQKLL